MITQVSRQLDYTPVIVQHVSHLFMLLADPEQRVNVIIFEIDRLYSMQKTTVFDILAVTATLVNCKPGANDVPLIAVTATMDTCPQLIRNALGTHVHSVYPAGPGFSMQEKSLCIQSMLNGDNHVPSRVQDMLHPRRKPSATGVIELTARQSQIVSLICDRDNHG